MNPILIYSRPQNQFTNKSIEFLCEKLNQVGYYTEQTHSTQVGRILLNPYQIIHFFIEELPLNINELIFLSVAKAIGKPCVLSLLNNQNKISKAPFQFFCPDALTLSQTNYLQHYRDWNCSKSLLPLLPRYKLQNFSLSSLSEKRSLLIPLEKSLNEVFSFKHQNETYFDGRALLKQFSTTELRKKWNHFLKDHQIQPQFHLILSEEKIFETLADQSCIIVLASPNMKHTDFTKWLEVSMNRNHLIILNDFQATGFSQSWTSGQNCIVISSSNWTKNLNLVLLQNDFSKELVTRIKNSELSEPIINELSRLYTKILHQKTTLLSTDSAKMKA